MRRETKKALEVALKGNTPAEDTSLETMEELYTIQNNIRVLRTAQENQNEGINFMRLIRWLEQCASWNVIGAVENMPDDITEEDANLLQHLVASYAQALENRDARRLH